MRREKEKAASSHDLERVTRKEDLHSRLQSVLVGLADPHRVRRADWDAVDEIDEFLVNDIDADCHHLTLPDRLVPLKVEKWDSQIVEVRLVDVDAPANSIQLEFPTCVGASAGGSRLDRGADIQVESGELSEADRELAAAGVAEVEIGEQDPRGAFWPLRDPAVAFRDVVVRVEADLKLNRVDSYNKKYHSVQRKQ